MTNPTNKEETRAPHSRELAEYVDGLIEAQRETRGDYLTYGTPDPELVDIAALLRREPSVEEVARVIANQLLEQDGAEPEADPFGGENYKWPWIDQGEVDFLQIAQAVAALWGREPG